MESGVSAIFAVWPAQATVTSLAPPGLVSTSTSEPSEFLAAAWYTREVAVLFGVAVTVDDDAGCPISAAFTAGASPLASCDATMIAPRRNARACWTNAQYNPVRVISFVCEWIWTRPPQSKGPMFGRPRSSRARFHMVMLCGPWAKMPAKVAPHLLQLVK